MLTDESVRTRRIVLIREKPITHTHAYDKYILYRHLRKRWLTFHYFVDTFEILHIGISQKYIEENLCVIYTSFVGPCVLPQKIIEKSIDVLLINQTKKKTNCRVALVVVLWDSKIIVKRTRFFSVCVFDIERKRARESDTNIRRYDYKYKSICTYII